MKFVERFLLLLILISSAFTSFAQQQEQDSIGYLLNQLDVRIDSLKYALEDAKDQMVSVSDLNSLFTNINEDQQEFTNADRRSKRKALDSLFKAVIQRPGKTSISGQMLSVFQWDGQAKHPTINTLVAHTDLFAISSFTKNGLAFINLQGVLGDGTARYFDSYSGFHAGEGNFQSPDGIDRINVTEAWLEYTFNWLKVTAGKIDLTNYFDPNSVANDEYTQFLSGGFVNSTAFAVPSNSPGMLFGLDLSHRFSFLVGVASQDNSGDKIFEDLYAIFQLGKEFFFKNQQIGAIRLLGYNSGFQKNRWGFGTSADFRIINKLYAYGRYGFNQDSLAANFGVGSSYSIGIQLRNVGITNSSRIILGAAYGQTHPQTEQGALLDEESFEGYVKIRVKNFLHVSPHIQWIKNGQGLENNELTLYGMRMLVLF